MLTVIAVLYVTAMKMGFSISSLCPLGQSKLSIHILIYCETTLNNKNYCNFAPDNGNDEDKDKDDTGCCGDSGSSASGLNYSRDIQF